MRVRAALIAMLGMVATCMSGCMTGENLAIERQRSLPPVLVMRAAPEKQYWRNVTLQDVEGAPEFRWFDGGALLTTRPTRKQVFDLINDDLARLDMQADSRVQGDYMLYIKFDDLHGPDMIPFTDKRASTNIAFRLVRWRTGQIVKETRFSVAYEAALGGVPPEVVRNALLGPLGVARDSAYAIPGGAFTGALFGLYIFDLDPLRSEFRGTPISPVMQIGPINGTSRRYAATHQMLHLAFDRFLQDVARDGSIDFKQAVSCRQLNPRGERISETLETRDSYAIDCPDSHYMESRAHMVYARPFDMQQRAPGSE